jgi:hypothetical protein
MHAEDLDTIETILTDYGLDDMLDSEQYQELLSRLQTRENIMVTDQAPRFIYRDGLDRIIKQY